MSQLPKASAHSSTLSLCGSRLCQPDLNCKPHTLKNMSCEASTHAIFISYRRSDSDGHANNLHYRLSLWFDADALFYDKASIDMGAIFPSEIEAALDRAAVVLVLIGPGWLEEINQRVGIPSIDYVRHEVARALAANKNIIPVYLGGVTSIDTNELHPQLQTELAGLGSRNGHFFQGNAADWDNQFVRLREKLATHPGVPTPRYRPPSGAAQPRRLIDHQLSPHFRDPNDLLPTLHARLHANKSTAIVVRAALYGMGGVGKTQLALKYSLDYPDGYAGIWWFRAETATSLQLDADACCREVSTTIAQGETPTATLKSWLDRQDTPWLLVYDNAESAESLRPHLPQGSTHHILVTSRAPNWRGLLGEALELAVWSPEQGALFFSTRLPGRKEADLRALSTDLGGLPLALEQAAAYIESTNITVTAYRSLLTDIKTQDTILDEGRTALGYKRTVIATLSLAFARLSTAAKQALRLLAYAAPEPFPERFLREATGHLPEALATAAADELAWQRLVAELRTYALATRTHLPPWAPGADEEPALNLHRLTQLALRARLATPSSDCANLQVILRAVCPQDAQPPTHWPRYAALLPHVTGLDHYLDTGWLNRRHHVWLLDRLASYLQFGPALYAEATHWFRRALDINRNDLGDGHPDTLGSMNNLAYALRDQGGLTGARELLTSALKMGQRTLGDEHPDILTSMDHLASTLKAQGDLIGALELQKSVLAVQRRTLGDKHPGTLIFMSNLAGILKALDDLTGARELLTSALKIGQDILGDEDPIILTDMNNFASILKAQGDLIGAFELQRSVLAKQKHILGEKHPKTIISAWNLFATALQLNDTATTKEVLDKYLLPLLQANPAQLSSDLRTIHNQLLLLLTSATSPEGDAS